MTGHVREGEGSARTGHLGLYTDLYELRMVESYLRRGMTEPATFSLFVRPSAARPWWVALGVARALEVMEAFTFGPQELAELGRLGVDSSVRDQLAAIELTGEVWAVEEGTIVLGQEPILEVTAPLPIAQLLETAVMNVVQLPMLIATKAARCALVAGGGQLADFGFRRASGTPLLAPVWRDGKRLGETFDKDSVRTRVQEQLEALPAAWRMPPYPDDPPVPTVGPELQALTDEVRRSAPDGEVAS